MSKLDQARAKPVIDELSEAAMTLAQAATEQINAISLMQAMQEGYKMCCRDHGIDEPSFPNAFTEAMKGMGA